MKLLSIAVPCYNSQDYLDRSVASLLPGGNEVEILLVDDGSTDRTPAMADAYAARYPEIIRAIHKPNGGHGSAVNTGLAAATGMFFKVVDSDDSLAPDSYRAVLAFLRQAVRTGKMPDMLVANYVYDKEGARHKYVMKPKGLPKDRYITWHDVRRIRKYHFLLMHSLIYRTKMLQECGLRLPEHTFYVDNIYAFYPFPFVRSLYYLDTDLYLYYIGRQDQSVNETVMLRRIDQNIRVNEIMAEQYRDARKRGADRACSDYMLNYLEMITIVSCSFLNLGGTKEHLDKKAALWARLKEIDPATASKLRRRLGPALMNLPGETGRRAGILVYRIAQVLRGFN